MISKDVFLREIDKLQELFGYNLTDRQFGFYYEALSPDFTDEAFVAEVKKVMRNSYKFPPIAAFYKDDYKAPSPLSGCR